MNVNDLEKTGIIHDEFAEDWRYYGLAFRAGRPFIEEALFKHPQETQDNYNNRLLEAFNFPYCQNIVTIYNYFLTEKSAIREIDPSIAELPAWESFQSNADLYGTNFDAFLGEAQKLSGAYGVVGILVDYPKGLKVKGDETARPYLSIFTPNNILDWEIERDVVTGIPTLTYIKVKEAYDTYLVWTKDSWTRYTVIAPEYEKGSTYNTAMGVNSTENDTEVIVATGINRLGKVPFVFLPNIKDTVYPYLGISDLRDASYVNAAIIRTLSMGNEVVRLAGFPMLLLPKESENAFTEDTTTGDEEVIVSEDSVLQYDPDTKNGKPSWLESPIEPSIDAILKWMDRLTEEMYRAANLGGLHQNRDKAQTKSGTYLRYQFQQTNSVLSKKADSLIEAEIQINELWCLWEDVDYDESKMKVSRIKEFAIDSLQVEIENMITSMENVMSNTFKQKQQVRLATYTYPDLTEKELTTIETEVGASLKEEPDNSEGEEKNE